MASVIPWIQNHRGWEEALLRNKTILATIYYQGLDRQVTKIRSRRSMNHLRGQNDKFRTETADPTGPLNF